MHLALGGCLGAPPVRFGLTADTGGHIAYVLEAAAAQAALASVRAVSIVTRLFHHDRLGAEFATPRQRIDAKTTIDRVATSDRRYLEKEALASDLPAFTEAFCTHLAGLRVLPDVIHAHFADAASVALAARTRFGVPVVYTPHALGIQKRTQTAPDAALETRIVSERHAIGASDAMIVSTQNEAMHQVAAYGVAGACTPVRCIAPGVPHQAPGHRSAAAWLGQWLEDPSKPIVLAIARPVRKKNLAAIVRAFTATPQLHEAANLVVLAGQHGAGLPSPEERETVAALSDLCRDPCIRGRVALPPSHDAGDVAALYAMAARGGVFVNPALHEPFGLTLLEAAAAEVPVVATRFGGAADIVASIGHGVVVDPCSEAQIGAACLAIVSDAALHGRYARAARLNVGAYSWARYAAESVALYAALRCRPARRATDKAPPARPVKQAGKQAA